MSLFFRDDLMSLLMKRTKASHVPPHITPQQLKVRGLEDRGGLGASQTVQLWSGSWEVERNCSCTLPCAEPGRVGRFTKGAVVEWKLGS